MILILPCRDYIDRIGASRSGASGGDGGQLPFLLSWLLLCMQYDRWTVETEGYVDNQMLQYMTVSIITESSKNNHPSRVIPFGHLGSTSKAWLISRFTIPFSGTFPSVWVVN